MAAVTEVGGSSVALPHLGRGPTSREVVDGRDETWDVTNFGPFRYSISEIRRGRCVGPSIGRSVGRNRVVTIRGRGSRRGGSTGVSFYGVSAMAGDGYLGQLPVARSCPRILADLHSARVVTHWLPRTRLTLPVQVRLFTF